MNVFNSLPKDTVEIRLYEEVVNFFTYCMEEESRQPQYTENYLDGTFSLKIFWVKKEMNLGFGIANDWKSKMIKWYKFGTEKNWNKFKAGFSAQFLGDNS